MARSASKISRQRAVWLLFKTQTMPNSTECRRVPLQPGWRILSFRSKRSRAILDFNRTEPRIQVPKDGEEHTEQGDLILLQKIFAQIRARTDRDFSRYKRSTILRRISRRMQLNHVEDLQRYLDRLREQPEEVRALADDFLVTVTNFFRDTEVFDKLEHELIPKLFNNKGPGDTVRLWSVGCATGEEAYSLAILLVEHAKRNNNSLPQVQVFASDMHKRSLEKARDGMYPGDIETDIRPDRLKQFFRKGKWGLSHRERDS